MVRRNPWLVVGAGVLGLVCVLIAGGAGYWRYANTLPVYPVPKDVMPVPNAYDDYVAAGQMSEAAGGATVDEAAGHQGGAGASRASRSGLSPQAYEAGVSLEQLRAVVARNRPALARLREGFRKSYRSPPVLSFNQGFPELAQFRNLARVLVSEGKLAEREGRPDAAARSYLDCLRLGTDVPRGGSLIHGLVGIAIQSIGLSPLQQVAGRLDGPTARAAAREMARLDARAPPLGETLADEKQTVTASLLEVFRQPGRWQEMLGSSGSGSPDPGDILLALRIGLTPKRQLLDHIRGYIDAIATGSRQPYYAQSAPPPIPDDPLSHTLLPIFDQARFTWALRDARWRIAELRLAVRAHEQEHGAPPLSLGALVPAYLPAVPQDPFAPKPLVYRRTPAGVLIYSRGPDGKDDGGKDLGSQVNRFSRGDIVSMKRVSKR